MKISGLEKLTLMDYPGHVACIIFTQGCNFKCPFCHNAELISCAKKECLKRADIMSYLECRKKVLDGVVISGGEPLLQPGIKELIREVKAKGLKVKLDTNGTNYKLLKELLDEKLIDYVAMDIKADANNYAKIIGFEHYDFTRVKNAIDILAASGVDYEFRTTIVKEFHTLSALESICKYIGDKAKYYLQNFVDSDRVLEKGLNGFTDEELREIQFSLNKNYPNVKVRGI